MKIVVMSDSHGRDECVYSLLYENQDADMIIHLGDGMNDFSCAMDGLPILSSIPYIRVRGNCDFFSSIPVTVMEDIGPYKFYITHGYEQRVKSGVDYIYSEAKKTGRNVVLFGHTHIPYYKEQDGIYLFNPGSVHDGSYGIINIDNDGNISFEHKYV